MKNYSYENNLISKKELRNILGWSFTKYDSMQACNLADSLKYLGFKYASKAGISISIEDLRVPFIKTLMLKKANQDIIDAEKIYLKGKLTDVERFQKIIDTWSLTSEALKNQVIHYFKNYDPLNSIYIMAFSGARGNLSQVRQLVGMRGLMSDPSGQIMNLPIKKNFREGLTITDYLMSGYGARKGIIDTALKTANSGYLTRRLIDVAQDILIREKDCLTTHSFLIEIDTTNFKKSSHLYNKLLGRILRKPINNSANSLKIMKPISREQIKIFQQEGISKFYINSPLTCNLYRAVCQKCYGWDLANENLIDIGEAVGILAGQSIGEPGTQLTMRTFHTGGIFTSETSEQIINPVSGIIKFSQSLKTISLRTNRGEEVLLTKNSGSIILVPEDEKKNLIRIEISKNTIIFPKNNQYIRKDVVLAELINTNKQIKTEIKPIISYNSGEIFIPLLKNKLNLLNNNKLIWLLSGLLYSSPVNSFINFYSDCKINKLSFIFRTKILSYYKGRNNYTQPQKDYLLDRINIQNLQGQIKNAKLKTFIKNKEINDRILNYEGENYLLNTTLKNNKIYIQKTIKNEIGRRITNQYLTLTGGISFYDQLRFRTFNSSSKIIRYYNKLSNNFEESTYFNNILCSQYRNLIWLSEEIQKVNCDQNVILIKDKDFIGENFEIVPGQFSKSSGLACLEQKNNIIKNVKIKSGLVYEGQQFTKKIKKLYYPGEQIFLNINILSPSLCEIIESDLHPKLIIRPLEIYELPYKRNLVQQLIQTNKLNTFINFRANLTVLHKSNQLIKTCNSMNIVSELLIMDKAYSSNLNLQVLNNHLKNQVEIKVHKNISINNYIVPKLKSKSLQSCSLIQNSQFIDKYTIIAFLEATTPNSLEVVKFKINKQDIKQILLISNKHCKIIPSTNNLHKNINDFIINSKNIDEMGRVIIKNKNFITIQKGRPYFFPNCKIDNYSKNSTLKYKFLPITQKQPLLKNDKRLALNFSDILNANFKEPSNKIKKIGKSIQRIKQFNFPKLFLKKRGKLYCCLIPNFLRKFSVSEKRNNINFSSILENQNTYLLDNEKNVKKINRLKIRRTLLIKRTNLNLNKLRKLENQKFDFTFVQFSEYPFKKFAKSIGLYSITEDYFEQESNSVFCKNNEFIEEEKTIGLLNLEKEITGDIVQGLPRIEEILEARKRKLGIKRLPTSQKKGLLLQLTNIDTNFEFRKLGTVIKENEKVNPHRLLKSYFNYYGKIKIFYNYYTLKAYKVRFVDNYEGSYRSFKKVQNFVLNSVQNVYKSQGVTIDNKHLEIIIKQMTTKVLVTYEGKTPLLRREVVDLYHAQYVNKIVKKYNKEISYYVPILLGITKASLNNPSFISAASFQETTKVLTHAAIEGRIDWLKGLKENIIIGHLIPSGTGARNYKYAFQNYNH